MKPGKGIATSGHKQRHDPHETSSFAHPLPATATKKGTLMTVTAETKRAVSGRSPPILSHRCHLEAETPPRPWATITHRSPPGIRLKTAHPDSHDHRKERSAHRPRARAFKRAAQGGRGTVGAIHIIKVCQVNKNRNNKSLACTYIKRETGPCITAKTCPNH